jgi:hypothetical protein
LDNPNRLEGFLSFQNRLNSLMQAMRQEHFWNIVQDLANPAEMAGLVRRLEAESEGSPS